MPESSRKKSQLQLPLIIIAIILVVFLVFIIFSKRQQTTPAIDANSQKKWELSGQDRAQLAPRQTSDIDTTKVDSNSTGIETHNKEQILSQCQKTSTNLINFFNQLPKQDYIKAYEITIEPSAYINKIIIKLLNNPPIITNETDDLFNILKNGAHFYRILGSKDISLIKDILIYENEYIENIMASMYEWSLTSTNCPKSTIRFNFPIKKLYEYSAFFLNTLGGQSYLFRRESRTRVLIKYYSTLVLDRAIQANQNKYEINILHTLNSTKEDLEDAEYLVHKNVYLTNISRVISKYDALISK